MEVMRLKGPFLVSEIPAGIPKVQYVTFQLSPTLQPILTRITYDWNQNSAFGQDKNPENLKTPDRALLDNLTESELDYIEKDKWGIEYYFPIKEFLQYVTLFKDNLEEEEAQKMSKVELNELKAKKFRNK